MPESKLSLNFSTLVDLLSYRSLHQTEKIAFTFLQDGETEETSWTYQDLDRRSRAIASQLQALGLTGERALLLYQPGLDYLAAFFGCLYAGVVAVPAYPPRNKRNTPRIKAILKDSEAAIALTTTTIKSRIQSLLEPEIPAGVETYYGASLHGGTNLQWLTTDNLPLGIEGNWQKLIINSDTLAFLQYTSGSTGTPKGVMLTHGNLIHNTAVTYQCMEHSANSKFVSWLPTYHDMGLIGGILQPLYGGFPCVLMTPTSFLQRPYSWLEAISRYRGTTSGAPNFAYELCVQKITPEQKQTLDLSSWDVAFNGAEPIRNDTLNRFAETFAACGFRKEAFYPCYGLAEASLMVTGSRKSEMPVVRTIDEVALERNQVVEADISNENIRTLVSSGQTIADQNILIVNPETLTRCQPNEVGEIWVSSPSVGQGYWNQVEEINNTFQAYTADTKEGKFLRTGDLGFLQNGELFVTGRAKDLIIIRGRNLYPQDIELTAERSHPSLRAGSVASFAVEVAGEEQLVIVQEVEFRQQPNIEEVTTAIRQAVAEEHEIQVYAVVLIKAGTIPKTSSGKIQRRATCAQYLAGDLEVLGSIVTGNKEWKESDRTLNRKSLLAVTSQEQQKVLKLYIQQIVDNLLQVKSEVNHSLSAVGLDSLKIFELKNRLETDFEITLSVTELFGGISLDELAARIIKQITVEAPVLSAISPVYRNQSLPLSFAQERLWFFDQLEPGNPCYNLAATVHLQGQLNVEALIRSLNEIIKRHEIFRTKFVSQNCKPVQVILDEITFKLAIINLADFSAEEREAEIENLCLKEARSPFDLSQAPLLRGTLLRLSQTEYKLLLTAQHIIFDGWSLGILIQELSSLYAETVHEPSLHKKPKIQYADYAVWQRNWLQGEILHKQLAYWKQQLSGDLPVLNLPTDYPRPAVQTYNGARISFEIPQELTQKLNKLSQQEGTTLFMTLLAAFKTLIYRYTGQEDILIGAPIANRDRAGIKNLIGFFVNTLVLRTDISDNPSFKELLHRVRETALGAYAHQELPFEKLVEKLQPERDLSYSPLFQVSFALQNGLTQTLELPDLQLSLKEVDTKTAKFDLTLFLEETAQGLIGAFEYNTDLFKSSTIERLIGHLQTLLTGIIDNPEATISTLPLLTATEQHQLLLEWNNTGVDYPQDKCIHQLFEAQVEKTPDAVAVIFEDKQLTYQEVNYQANKLAKYLQTLGVKPESLVGICVERSPQMVVAILGILKAGAAYVPLDPAYPQERLAFMLEDTQATVLLTQQQFVETFYETSLQENKTKIICLDTDWHLIESANQDNCISNVNSNNLAYVIYTSGSTGLPKGVTIKHRNAAILLHWAQSVFTSAELTGVLASTSICFDLSVFELFVPLSWGGTVILAETALHLPSLPSAEQVTLINTVPSAIAQLLQTNSIPASVSTINLAGEALPPQLVQQLYQLPTIERVFNLYGPSEDTTYSTYTLLERDARFITIGRPIAKTQVYILDSQQQLVPVGVPGEIYIGGDGLAKGYLNRPELTAEKFVAHPFIDEPAAKLYKTGDLARYLPDGNIEYIGRIDYQVKIRGFRIELGEIESVINQYSAVQQAVVVAKEYQPGDKRLIAYLVCSQKNLEVADLRTFLKDKLPEYMIPSAFVILESLPLTPNGKLDRKALPAPDFTNSELTASFVKPRTTEEKKLAEIWSQVLGVAKVGIYDNFFELGGHSLLATQLIAKVGETFQVELPLRYLFQSPTVESLAAQITQQQTDLTAKSANLVSTITPDIDRKYQPFPLTDIQQAYWVGRSSAFELGNIATHIYVEIDAVDLDLERFNQAWQRSIERHDMLRAIVLPDGQQQILKEVPTYQVKVLNLRGQSAEVVNGELKKVRDRLSHQILPSDTFPLFEISASRLDEHRTRLHFSFDLLIADAWSFQIIGRELAALYQNRKAELTPLQISFRDYVLGEVNCRKSEQYQRSQEYWRDRLTTLPPPPELPLAQNPSAIKHPRFVRHSGKLEAAKWLQLKNYASKVGITPSAVLLAAFAEVLTVWSKSPRFTLTLTLFNRLPLHSQVNELVGDFTSLSLLAVDNSTEDSFGDRARRLQAQLWEDLDHRDVSGVQVLRELARTQGRLSSALMPVVFTSTLTQEGLGEQKFPLDWLGEMTYGITQTPQVFLDHQVAEEAGALVFNWDAVEAIFPAGMLDDMFAAYCNFLESLAEKEENWQEIHPQLIPHRQLQQLAAINATDASLWADTGVPPLLHTLFTAQVDLQAEKAAVITTERTLTYAELYRLANQLGHKLRDLGAKPNQLVAVVMEKGWEQVVAVLGILMSGAAYVPIDPKLPQERRSHLFAQADIQLVVTQPCVDKRLYWSEGIQRICVDSKNVETRYISSLQPIQKPEDIAYVIYTSGSTGLPKGVAIDHRGAVNTILDINHRFNVQTSDKVFALSALNFDLSVYDIFGTLAAGGTIIIPDACTVQEPSHWAELMKQEKITVWNSVPALMQMMVDYGTNNPAIFQNLRLVMMSGDWLPLNLPNQIKALNPETDVISLGGATEASIWSIYYPIESVNPNWKSIPYGKPLQNQRFYVLNHTLEPCPIWVTGQLYIGGIGLAKCYWRDEAKTSASFITHPRTGEKLYKPGDLGRYLPDGNIEFLGREDFQVKIGGYRIELGEIEAALLKHPAVKEAVVNAVGDKPTHKRLVAYLVFDSLQNPPSDELRSFLSEKLPAYMIPTAFVMLENLPLTANGKVNRQALPIPSAVQELDSTVIAPRNPTETILTRLWFEVLGVEKIGIYDNFFDLGGDSILVTQLIAKVRETFNIELPLRDFFETPTIAGQVTNILHAPQQRLKVEQTAELLMSITELSDDEVEKMLAEKTALIGVGA
ncbi:amino acid adenylation domain-containing protein [Microcoleus sp. FACHB-831]|uniref:non-ribosomal peptide synthetase n=1 Tax=Microcoleus sp. FACHB-831 TaxID=2692827 RepID=UPI0016821CE8|nr:non-ribosomal peptide synthetase [Microcoleus sp. FACHB-831]MBD1924286.1 amino acid adenylation domain-containing protein [Microcoleus sp. FACHB-831]